MKLLQSLRSLEHTLGKELLDCLVLMGAGEAPEDWEISAERRLHAEKTGARAQPAPPPPPPH